MELVEAKNITSLDTKGRTQFRTFVKESPYTLEKAQLMLESGKANFNLPPAFDYANFKPFANGFFQAEGHIGCRAKGTTFIPVFSLNQNFNDQSLVLFLTM